MIDNHMGLTEHDGLDRALAAASADAAAAGARVFPCTVFQQGKRTMISTSFPYAFLARQVVSESAEKGGDPANTTNRPLMADHVKNINTYVRENRDNYILPPVTLNARQLPALHVPRGNFKNRLGLNLPGFRAHRGLPWVSRSRVAGLHATMVVFSNSIGASMPRLL
ncbi:MULTISPECIES: DNA sulfur modification protein DndB [unclassified Nocardia]|uniref:DNA sulfur modification protein DndB n=1 Tax=unclassified Nocardia TaxID=2637762 RepID=UPI00278BBDB2|nr:MULTISPECIES: DNA sulfur modification protein DndB [unclassified Nocardia]